MRLNEYDTVQFVVKWMIENKAGNELDITDAYLIEKITDACHGDLRKHCLSNVVANNELKLAPPESVAT
jgi:hypothetical protein